jgi:hypothetical protein
MLTIHSPYRDDSGSSDHVNVRVDRRILGYLAAAFLDPDQTRELSRRKGAAAEK